MKRLSRLLQQVLISALTCVAVLYGIVFAFNGEILARPATDILRSFTETYAPPGDLYEPLAIQEVPGISDEGWVMVEFTAPYAGPYDIELMVDERDFIPLDALNSMALNAYLDCSNPGRKPGYAGEFGYRMVGYGFEHINANAHVSKLVEVTREDGRGYRLAGFVAGRDLPVDRAIKCDIRLTEWLLESGPSHLRVVRSE